MNLGFLPYTLRFTYQIIASQLVYQKVEPPSKCSIVKNQIFPLWHFLGVLLSNTLKRIKTLSDNATEKKYVSFSEDSGEYISYNPYPKNSFSRNVSSDSTSFESFAAHPSQRIWAFVTEKPAAKQVLPESLKPFCEKYSVPFLPTETLNDFETETTPSPVDVFPFENFDAIESSFFAVSKWQSYQSSCVSRWLRSFNGWQRGESDSSRSLKSSAFDKVLLWSLQNF